jgi:hypothetical protein
MLPPLWGGLGRGFLDDCHSQAPSNSPEGGAFPSFGGVRGGKTMNNEKPIMHYNIVGTWRASFLPYNQQKSANQFNINKNKNLKSIF